MYSQNVNLQSQNESSSSESIPSERESALPSPNNSVNNNESNYSNDNTESDFDGKCPAEPVDTGFASPRMIKDDHRIYDQNLTMKIHTLGSITANYFMAICAKFVRYNSLRPTNSNCGASSHKSVTFHGNAGKMLRRHNSKESHKQVILGLVNLHIEDSIDSWAKEKSQELNKAYNLYIRKLIHIFHFLA